MLNLIIQPNSSDKIKLKFSSEELTYLWEIIECNKKHCSDDKLNMLTSLEHKLKVLSFLDKQPDEQSINQVKDILFPNIEIHRNNAYNVKISKLNFTNRTFNCLNRANIKTLSEFLYMTRKDLLRIRSLGLQRPDEIIDVLKIHILISNFIIKIAPLSNTTLLAERSFNIGISY